MARNIKWADLNEKYNPTPSRPLPPLLDAVSVLREYAASLETDISTKENFKGFVSKAFGDDNTDINTALYLVVPKLDSYMYRVIEVIVPNYLNPFILEARLFARQPVNNLSKFCSSEDDFRNTMDMFVASPQMREILQFLTYMVNLKKK